MSNWIAITDGDLDDAKVAELIAALREEALGVGQTDPIPRFIADTVTEIRSCIRFAGTPVESDETTIPKSMKELAVKKVVRRAKDRLGQLDKDDRADEEDYQARLKLLTAGKWPVEAPDNPVTEPVTQAAAPTIEVASSRPRVARGSDLSGL